MRRALTSTLIGGAAASGGGTIKLNWSDCGDSSTHGHITSLSPTSVTLGTKTSLAGKGKVDETIPGATYKIVAKEGFIPIFSHTGDACKPDTIKLPAGAGEIDMKGFKCPLSAGAAELDLDLTLSSSIPAKLARITIELTAETSSGDKALCVQIKTSPENLIADGEDGENLIADPGFSFTDPKEWERIAAVVNAANAGWTADPQASGRFSTLGDVQTLLGTFLKGHPNWRDMQLPEYNTSAQLAVPQSFDPRTQWPKCSVIGKVRNQAGCGSCWAFGSTESFEGSRCVATKQDIEFSADDTAACSSWFGNGCNGGQPSAANQWFVSKGVATGGEYGTSTGCLPYVCPPCKKGLYPPDCPTDQCSPLLKCTSKCSNSGYSKSYREDKTKAAHAFSVRSVSNMQQALMTTGPLLLHSQCTPTSQLTRAVCTPTLMAACWAGTQLRHLAGGLRTVRPTGL